MSDILIYVAAFATIVAAVYAALGYHRPPGGSGPVGKQKISLWGVCMRWLPPVIALCAVGFGYYDRHYVLQNAQNIPQPIPADASRLEISRLSPGFQDSHLFINAYLVNNGKNAVIGMAHWGLIVSATSVLAEPDIASLFLLIRYQASVAPAPSGLEIQPGSNQIWFTIPVVKEAATVTQEEWNSGREIYLMNIMKYKDSQTPNGYHIYNETCQYYVSGIAHLCESGHNRIYMLEDPS